MLKIVIKRGAGAMQALGNTVFGIALFDEGH